MGAEAGKVMRGSETERSEGAETVNDVSNRENAEVMGAEGARRHEPGCALPLAFRSRPALRHLKSRHGIDSEPANLQFTDDARRHWLRIVESVLCRPSLMIELTRSQHSRSQHICS
jgi:hypothetical protein